MNMPRAAHAYANLAFVALAGGVACVVWADELGGYRFIGVSIAVVIAMVSLARISALRRAQAAIAPPRPRQPRKRPSVAQTRDDVEEARIEARLAALGEQAHDPLGPGKALPDDAGVAIADMEVIDDDEPVTPQELEALRAQIAGLQPPSAPARPSDGKTG